MKISFFQKITFYLLLTIFALMVFFPVGYAFLVSFMTPQEVLMGKFYRAVFHL